MSNCLYKLRLTFKGLTMLEMIISLAMIAVIFVVIVPQFKNMENSWASRRASAEAIQNGRILTACLSLDLAKAARITAVSDPCNTTGYIEFESNDANTYRCEIGADNIVEFGPVGNLADLAGPVSKLQFTCYALDDLDTPTTDVDSIRLVKVETTLTNSAPLGQDKNFTTAAYLQTNWFSADVAPNSSYEFNHAKTKTPVVLNIIGNRYLCAYTGDGDDGWAVVLAVDPDTWKITDRTHFEFDDIKGKSPALSKIDDEYYLCTYSGDGDAGWAQVLNVNMNNWKVTTETSLNYEAGKAKDSALTKIDDNHYLCAYNGDDDDGWAVVLNVVQNPTVVTTTISKESGEEKFDVSMPATRPDGDLYIAQICLKDGEEIESVPNGWTEITNSDMLGNIQLATYWKIGSSEPSEYTWEADEETEWIGAIHRVVGIDTSDPINVSGDDTGDSASPTAPSVVTTDDDCLILRMYGAEGAEQASTYWPSGTTPIFQDDSSGSVVGAAAYEDQLSAGSTGTGAFSMTGSKKWVAATVAIATSSAGWQISTNTPFEFDSVKGKTPALSKIDDDHYLCVYSGDGDDGWAVVLTVDGATWDITKETPFEFDAAKGKTPALAKVDDEHYLYAYSADRDKGWATVLTVDNTTWNITKGTSFQFDSKKGKAITLAEIPYLPAGVSNRTDYLCVYSGDKDHGCAATLRVNETTWTITKGNPFNYDENDGDLIVYEDDKAKTPDLCNIDSIHFLCVYPGGQPVKRKKGGGGGNECEEKDHGWSIVLNVNPPLEP